MKINDLSKSLNIENKTLIKYLKDEGFKVSSHMQNTTDEMIEKAKSHFTSATKSTDENDAVDIQSKNVTVPIIEEKKFMPDDMIPCKSVTPWKLTAVGTDKNTVYHWEYFGDVEYIAYRDFQALRRTDYVRKPKFIIEDADLCYKWKHELQDTYKYFLGVDYPEEFFDLPDSKFEELLKKAPDVLKNVIKVTAMSMMRNENYPSVQKIVLIDSILGTCLKDFL